MQIRLTASSVTNIESDIEKIAHKFRVHNKDINRDLIIWAVCSNEIFLKRKVTEAIKKKNLP
jgi:hypothetical protein